MNVFRSSVTWVSVLILCASCGKKEKASEKKPARAALAAPVGMSLAGDEVVWKDVEMGPFQLLHPIRKRHPVLFSYRIGKLENGIDSYRGEITLTEHHEDWYRILSFIRLSAVSCSEKAFDAATVTRVDGGKEILWTYSLQAASPENRHLKTEDIQGLIRLPSARCIWFSTSIVSGEKFPESEGASLDQSNEMNAVMFEVVKSVDFL